MKILFSFLIGLLTLQGAINESFIMGGTSLDSQGGITITTLSPDSTVSNSSYISLTQTLFFLMPKQITLKGYKTGTYTITGFSYNKDYNLTLQVK